MKSTTLSPSDQRLEDLDLLDALIHAGHAGPVDEEPPAPRDLVDDAPRFGRADEDASDPKAALTESEAAAFLDMHQRLEARGGTLSDRQRTWAERRAAELGLTYGDPARRNAAVPAGRPVALLVDQLPKPLKPPGRR